MNIFVDNLLPAWKTFIDSECYVNDLSTRESGYDIYIVHPENSSSIISKSPCVIVSSFDLLNRIKKNKILEKYFVSTNYSASNFSVVHKEGEDKTVVMCVVKTLDNMYILYDVKMDENYNCHNQSIKKIIIDYKESAFCYEKMSYIDKRNIRRYQNKIIHLASDLLNKPLVSIWKYPYHHKNVFNLRIDVDPDRNVSEVKALQRINNTIDLLSGYNDRVTMALNFYKRMPNYYEFVNSFKDIFDIANHGFFHHNFFDKYHLKKNISLPESLLFSKQRPVSGYISPEYFWNKHTPSIISQQGYSYASSLGNDYCSYPYRQIHNGSVQQYFEIPTNPLVYGKFKQYYNNIDSILNSYTNLVINSSLNTQEPCLLYEHPAIIGEHPDVAKTLFDTADNCGFYPITLSGFSDWLSRRMELSSNIYYDSSANIIGIDKPFINMTEFSVSYRAPNCNDTKVYKLKDVSKVKISSCSPAITIYNEPDDYTIGSTLSYNNERTISIFSNYKHLMKTYNAYYLFYKYLFLKKYPLIK